MTDSERHAELVRQLQTASSMHGEYEKQALNGEYDQEWAAWYAQYMVTHGWNDLFLKPWQADGLAEKLRRADRDHKINAPETPWSEYYANAFPR